MGIAKDFLSRTQTAQQLKEMQIKTTLRFHITSRTLPPPNVGEDMG
jgi:hypothetical protein